MRKVFFYTFLGCMSCFSSFLKAEVQICESGYQVELYVQYANAGRTAGGMCFDSQGNLYIAQNNAQVNKITAERDVIYNWATGYNTPWGIIDASGTNYGNQLYVTDHLGNRITAVSYTGSVSTFSTLSATGAIAIDRSGNYGNNMYSGTTGDDKIYKITTAGQKTVFSSYFASLSGGIAAIDFAPSSKYGGGMYVTTWSSTDPRSGLYYLNNQGQAVKFSPNIVWGSNLDFDAMGLFDNDLFLTGKLEESDSLHLIRVDENGIATPFIKNTIGEINGFTFGNDGALYIHEFSYSGVSNILRITPIPEPTSILLLVIGGLILRRTRRY